MCAVHQDVIHHKTYGKDRHSMNGMCALTLLQIGGRV